MSGEVYTTVTGNLVEDPVLRFTQSGAAVCNVAIASTPRSFNKDTNEWNDGDTWFVRGSIWRQPAENIAESLEKGMRVIAYGKLKQRNWEKDGVKHSVVEMDIEEIGPSLKFTTAKVNRGERVAAGAGASRGSGKDDPWGSAPKASGDYADEPPF